MTGPMRGRRRARRSCHLHGAHRCERDGEAARLYRALENRRWRADALADTPTRHRT